MQRNIIMIILLLLPSTTVLAEAKVLDFSNSYHYISARTGQTATEKIVLKNTSADAVSRIDATIDNPDINIINHCASGLLANQICEIEYRYSPKTDTANDHQGIQAKQSSISIRYQTSSVNQQLDFFVVSTHIDTQRIVNIPASLSNFHELPSLKINNIFFDREANLTYAATFAGLSVSGDAGKTWQTLSTYSSTYNVTVSDRSNLMPLYVSTLNNKIYMVVGEPFFNDGKLMISEDHGASWRVIDKEFDDVKALYVKDNVIILISAFGVQISHDDGKTWEKKLGNDIFSSVTFGTIYGNEIFLLAANTFDPTESGVYQSADQGISWTPIPMQGVCRDEMGCHYNDAKIHNNTIYVAVSGATSHTIVKSIDKGKTWENVSPACNNIPSATLYFDDTTMIASNGLSGVQASCISEDDGVSWQPLYTANRGPGFIGPIIRIGTQKGAPQWLGIYSEGGIFSSNDNIKEWVKMTPAIDYQHQFIDKAQGDEKSNDFLIDSHDTCYPDDKGNYNCPRWHLIKNDGLLWKTIHFKQAGSGNNDKIFFINNSLYAISYEDRVGTHFYQSTDEGDTWNELSVDGNVDTNNYYHTARVGVENSAVYLIDFDKQKRDIIISHDLGKSWQSISISSTNITTQTYCSIDPYYHNNRFYFVTQHCTDSKMDGLYMQQDDQYWAQVFSGGSIYGLQFEKNNIYFVISADNYHDSSTLQISHDDGLTFHSKIISNRASLSGVHGNTIFLSDPIYDNPDNAEQQSLLFSNDDGTHWGSFGMLSSQRDDIDNIQTLSGPLFLKGYSIISSSRGLFVRK